MYYLVLSVIEFDCVRGWWYRSCKCGERWCREGGRILDVEDKSLDGDADVLVGGDGLLFADVDEELKGTLLHAVNVSL